MTQTINDQKQSGFTLVEVLVALTIIAVALAASTRLLGVSTNSVQALHQHKLGLLSANNLLAEMRLQKAFPDIGKYQSSCAQGGVEFKCEQLVQATANSSFRRVTVLVKLPNGNEIARLDALATRMPW